MTYRYGTLCDTLGTELSFGLPPGKEGLESEDDRSVRSLYLRLDACTSKSFANVLAQEYGPFRAEFVHQGHGPTFIFILLIVLEQICVSGKVVNISQD